MTTAEPTEVLTREKSLNLLGISALALIGLQTLTPLLTRAIYRAIIETGAGGTFLTIISPLFSLVLTLLAVGLALAGALQRHKTRYRWAAIGALTTGIYLLAVFLTTALGQFVFPGL